MNKKTIVEVMDNLAAGQTNRPEIARLRDVFDSVEAAMSAGVSRIAILDALHGQGFTMTLKSFDNAMYRIRQQRRKLLGKSQHVSNKAVEKVIQNLESDNQNLDETISKGSHAPDDLAKIMSAPVDLDALSKHAKRKK